MKRGLGQMQALPRRSVSFSHSDNRFARACWFVAAAILLGAVIHIGAAFAEISTLPFCFDPGQARSNDGKCCAVEQLSGDGICCPETLLAQKIGCGCWDGSSPTEPGGFGIVVCTPLPTCPSGMQSDKYGQCQCTDPDMMNLGESCCPHNRLFKDGNGKFQCCSMLLGWRGQCCGPDSVPQSDGSCCPFDQPNKTCCPAGQVPLTGGGCCAPYKFTSTGQCCPPGQQPSIIDRQSPGNKCVPTQSCGPDKIDLGNGVCCDPTKIYYSQAVPEAGPQCCGGWVKPDGECGVPYINIKKTECTKGYGKTADGNCCADRLLTTSGECCTDGATRSRDRSTCIPSRGAGTPPPQPPPPGTGGTTPCPVGQTKLPDGCCPNEQVTVDGTCCPSLMRLTSTRHCCPPNFLRGGIDNKVCCSLLEAKTGLCRVCPLGTVFAASSSPGTTERTCCPSTQLTSNGLCCAPGQKPVGESCVWQAQPGHPAGLPVLPQPLPPTDDCKTNQWYEGRCCTLEDIRGNKCGGSTDKPSDCGRGQHWDRAAKSCVADPPTCKSDEKLVRGKCVSTDKPKSHDCTGGQRWYGQKCVCPARMHWNGSKCVFGDGSTDKGTKSLTTKNLNLQNLNVPKCKPGQRCGSGTPLR